MPYPYFFGNFMQNVPKTPQQLEAEQKALMEQYSKSYESMMNTGAGNAANASRNTYIRTSDFELVKQAQPPSDGTPMVFLDEEHMCLYSKKYVNGVPCIQTFGLSPMENPTSRQSGSIEGKIDSIIARLGALEDKVSSAGGAKDNDQSTATGAHEHSQGA